MFGYDDVVTNTLEDIAYRDARYSFENKRDKIMEEAGIEYGKGNYDRAQELLDQANAMQFTGLQWECD